MDLTLSQLLAMFSGGNPWMILLGVVGTILYSRMGGKPPTPGPVPIPGPIPGPLPPQAGGELDFLLGRLLNRVRQPAADPAAPAGGLSAVSLVDLIKLRGEIDRHLAEVRSALIPEPPAQVFNMPVRN